MNVVEAGSLEQWQYSNPTHTVQWRINDPHIATARPSVFAGCRFEILVDRFRNDRDLAFGERLFERNSLDFLDVHDPIDDRRVVRWQHLAAGGPVDFDRVVAGWVMRRGHHDPAATLHGTDSERKLGRGSIIVQKIDRKAVCHHDRGTQFCKMSRVVAGIVSNGAREGARQIRLADDVLC